MAGANGCELAALLIWQVRALAKLLNLDLEGVYVYQQMDMGRGVDESRHPQAIGRSSAGPCVHVR